MFVCTRHPREYVTRGPLLNASLGREPPCDHRCLGEPRIPPRQPHRTAQKPYPLPPTASHKTTTGTPPGALFKPAVHGAIVASSTLNTAPVFRAYSS